MFIRVNEQFLFDISSLKIIIIGIPFLRFVVVVAGVFVLVVIDVVVVDVVVVDGIVVVVVVVVVVTGAFVVGAFVIFVAGVN